jgi:hypothetical protein
LSLSVEYAKRIVASLKLAPIPNFIAQAKAKQVLQEVQEFPENFPKFTEGLDERLTHVAFRMLSAGCSLLEHGDDLEHGNDNEGFSQLYAAGDLLESIYQEHALIDNSSSFNCLIGAMAFYACGHYSRAFVLIKKIETTMPVSAAIACFLRKERFNFVLRVNEILFAETSELIDADEIDRRAMELTITRSLALMFEHSMSGDMNLIELMRSTLFDAMLIGEGGSQSSYWWIARLLRLMFDDYEKGSLWTVLPSFFEEDGQEDLESYIKLLALSDPPVTELWKSQLKCISLALDEENRGGIVNLRTSAGKTRVAELAILKVFINHPDSKVLYLAPFRSLAFELERTFGKFLGSLGYSVSHLYGGSRFSGVDKAMVLESRLLIATPEKAKAMLRVAPELFDEVKLVIVDEGHLLGENERNIRNELFLEHLRLRCLTNDARMLLLSAVLPNAEELALWIGGSGDALAKSDWKPSAERFGILRWATSGVQIEWKGEQRCFNPDFVEFSKVLEPGKVRGRKFPRNKTEAVAATAVRLSKLGPVLIFAGQAQWVPSMAKAVVLALGELATDHHWPHLEWSLFCAVCEEELGADCAELEAARLGIICHSNRLPSQVRMAVESLMAAKAPLVIIATTTLGQGVNIGISSVIVSQTLIGKNTWISKRDFWNICGRAGRAFVDGEGKVLFAIDTTKTPSQVRKDEKRASEYLDIFKLAPVDSGLLLVVQLIKDLSESAGISFKLLLELVANGGIDNCGAQAENVYSLLDLIDDQLLALHMDFWGDIESDNVEWVEAAFRDSLAAVQSRIRTAGEDENVLLPFIKARAEGVLREVPSASARRAVVASGLPLSVGNTAFQDLNEFREMVDAYLVAEGDFFALEELVEKFEIWARDNAGAICDSPQESTVLGKIRLLWLDGTPLLDIANDCGKEALKICTEFYGYQLSWLFHAVAQKMDQEDDVARVEALSLAGLLLELGLPSEASAKVFLAGVRSRAASVELGPYVVNPSISATKIRRALLRKDVIESLRPHLSDHAMKWLGFLAAEHNSKTSEFPHFPDFCLDVSEGVDTIHIRQLADDDTALLSSVDGKFVFRAESTEELPFLGFANDPRFCFKRYGNVWRLCCRDPRLTP